MVGHTLDMFERFTDAARRVLVLAQEEALERSHAVLGTEHILLGLVADISGVAASALHEIGVAPAELRTAIVARIAPHGDGGRVPPFSPLAKRALEKSLGEALRLGHNHIGPEHLLIGLAATGEGLASEVLAEAGITAPVLRRVVARLAAPQQSPSDQAVPAPTPASERMTPAADAVVRAARSRAGRRPVGTHDLLAAILFSDRSAAVAALRAANVQLDDLRRAVESATTLNTSDQTPEEAVAAQIQVRLDNDRLVLAIEDHTLVESIRTRIGDTTPLSADNPLVAHQLGALWQQIHETLTITLDRATEGA